MPVDNAEIADMLERLGDLLEIEGANPFRVRAYREAAITVRSEPQAMADLLEQGVDLSGLHAIGRDLAAKIATIVDTGELPLLRKVESRVPPALADLMQIPGLGPQRVKTLFHELDIRSPEDLRRAASSGRVRRLKGFGQKTEQMILDGLARFSGQAPRTRLADAEGTARPLLAHLKKVRGVKDIVVAGSFRRRRETVGDLDILVTATQDSPVMADFIHYDQVRDVVSHGTTRSTVRLRSGLQVDLRVVPQVSYGAALVYFTGSKAHNIALRKRAIGNGWKMNEYGIFADDQRIAGRSEREVYRKVGLPVIAPELRENRGEIEAAQTGELPRLIEAGDIRGDLHSHTKASDGHGSLEQMAEAAAALGYEYLSINDHSQHVTVANGLDSKRLLRQVKAIDRLNTQLEGIVILKSIEVDILEDGRLDLPDSVLAELDFTVCSVHYKFNLSRRKQTERILRAMDNRFCNILAHPTGRLINERDAYQVELEKILQGARERGCHVELNANPQRLDLSDEGCRLARDMGVKIAISSDAHRPAGLDYMRYGIDQARRGWLEKRDVLNTRSLQQLKKLLSRD